MYKIQLIFVMDSVIWVGTLSCQFFWLFILSLFKPIPGELLGPLGQWSFVRQNELITFRVRMGEVGTPPELYKNICLCVCLILDPDKFICEEATFGGDLFTKYRNVIRLLVQFKAVCKGFKMNEFALWFWRNCSALNELQCVI